MGFLLDWWEGSWELPWWGFLDRADDGVCFEFFPRDELENGQTDLLHVLGQMDG